MKREIKRTVKRVETPCFYKLMLLLLFIIILSKLNKLDEGQGSFAKQNDAFYFYLF